MTKSLLKNKCYRFDESTGIWSRPDYIGLSYNDGDEIEKHLAEIINNATDISLLSSELKQHCTDWTTTYHLAATRANIMRPFSEILTGDVLEIGAGCGAITRYLGECGGNILALEGSPRRAAIARSRTRDLENVQVLAENFVDFMPQNLFDTITLIGVLEYANLFSQENNPHLSIISQIQSLLKPDGKLILAIENQLGMKYFAGAPEDHLGEPMIGIEGRYQRDQPQTFGRQAIIEILRQSSFDCIQFFCPFPDYKHSISIITEQGISNENFDAAALASQSVTKDPQLPANLNFSLELTWPEIFKNKLAQDFSNSFLILAGLRKKAENDEKILAYHYSVNRLKEFCRETLFISNTPNKIKVKYRKLYVPASDAVKPSNSIIEYICPPSAEYLSGRLLSTDLVEILTRKNWTIVQVCHFLRRYLSFIHTVSKSCARDQILNSPYSKVPGMFFDAVPSNIIVNANGEYSLIDQEWMLSEDIEIGHLLFRSLLIIISSLTKITRPCCDSVMTNIDFLDQSLRSIGIILTQDDYVRYANLESRIQQAVSGCRVGDFFSHWKDQRLIKMSSAELISYQRSIISNLESRLVSTNHQIESIYKSRSWKITRPLRFLHGFLPNFKSRGK